jgi:mono/diheme cytochrome c family protein
VRSILIAAVFGAALYGPPPAEGQSERAAVEGAKLYATYCVDCHGSVTGTPKANVPDLGLLTRRNKGVFPLERVEKLLSGTKQSPVMHGGVEMPVWGTVLMDRVHALSRYIESIQK